MAVQRALFLAGRGAEGEGCALLWAVEAVRAVLRRGLEDGRRLSCGKVCLRAVGRRYFGSEASYNVVSAHLGGRTFGGRGDGLRVGATNSRGRRFQMIGCGDGRDGSGDRLFGN